MASPRGPPAFPEPDPGASGRDGTADLRIPAGSVAGSSESRRDPGSGLSGSGHRNRPFPRGGDRLGGSGGKIPDEVCWILGGSAIYEDALPVARRMELTRVEATVEGDTRFPEVDWSAWLLESVEHHQADERHRFPFRFESWIRRG